MKSYRKTGVAVGLLFLIATMTFYVGHALVAGVLYAPDGLTPAGGADALTAGVLLFFVDGLAIVGIAFLMFPVLKRHSEPLALAYVGLRVCELAAVLLLMVSPLLLAPPSLVAPAGGVDVSASTELAAVSRAQYGAAMPLVFLCTAAAGTILAFVLCRAKLVPVPVVFLGVVGYPAMLVGTVLGMFELVDLQGIGLVLVWPVGLFELVFPIWLIARGFHAHDR